MGEKRLYLQDSIAIYRALKPEERKDHKVTIRNSAGWPLEAVQKDGRPVYVRFGRPPISLFMNFELNKNPVWYIQLAGFQANMGALPQLLEFHIKRFMDHNPDTDMWDEAADALEAEIVLTDMEEATPLIISERYYGSASNPLLGLAVPGYMSTKWHAMRNFLRRQREANLMTPARAATLLKGYLRNAIECHKGKIQSGGFQSARIEQALSVLMAFPKTPLKDVRCKEFYGRLHRNKVPFSIRHDPGLVSNYLFYLIFDDKNRDSGLNAGNLEIAIEMLIGSIGYLCGQENETIKYCFQGMFIMGGAGCYKITTKEGVLIARQKPNGVGADKVVEELNGMFTGLLQRYYSISTDDNKQTFINASRWTPVAIENLSCFEIVQGNIVGIPDENIKHRTIVCTEFRNAVLAPFIQFVFPRNDGQTNVSFVTVDLNKTNVRNTSVKIRKTNPNLACVATNQPCGDITAAEEVKTASAVTATMHPGAPAYEKTEGELIRFNNVSCTKFQGRQRINDEEPRRSILSLLLTQSHLISSILVALPNQSGILQFEINEPILCFLDWIFLYIRAHLSSVLEVDVKDSFSRIREGYEARGMACAVYKTVVALMAQDKSLNEVVLEANMRMMQSAIPLSEVRAPSLSSNFTPTQATHSPTPPARQVVNIAHCFLTRGLHSGCLVMSSLLLIHFNMPIIPFDHLQDFFVSDEVRINTHPFNPPAMSTDSKPFPDFTIPPCLSIPTMQSPPSSHEIFTRLDLICRVHKLEKIVADLQKSLVALEDDRAQRPTRARKSARTPSENVDTPFTKALIKTAWKITDEFGLPAEAGLQTALTKLNLTDTTLTPLTLNDTTLTPLKTVPEPSLPPKPNGRKPNGKAWRQRYFAARRNLSEQLYTEDIENAPETLDLCPTDRSLSVAPEPAARSDSCAAGPDEANSAQVVC